MAVEHFVYDSESDSHVDINSLIAPSPPRTIPTIETIADTRARLLALTSRRLIQFVDARDAALRLLDPPAKDGVKPAPDLAGAIGVLKGTGVLR